MYFDGISQGAPEGAQIPCRRVIGDGRANIAIGLAWFAFGVSVLAVAVASCAVIDMCHSCGNINPHTRDVDRDRSWRVTYNCYDGLAGCG